MLNRDRQRQTNRYIENIETETQVQRRTQTDRETEKNRQEYRQRWINRELYTETLIGRAGSLIDETDRAADS